MTSLTVKAQQSGSTAVGSALRVVVLTGASQTQNGATATQNGAAAHQATITTTVTGSWVFGAGFDVGSTALSANGNTTGVDSTHLSDGITHGSCRAASLTGTPGAISIGWSTPTDAGLLALVEILGPSLAIDASGPAFATGNGIFATTATFTPPDGSMLLALPTLNGGSGIVNCTVSDTSGLGLTWTPLIENHPSAAGYGGAHYTFMPATAALPAQPVVAPSLACMQASTW